MSKQRNLPNIPLPRDWPCRAKSAILHVISLAQFAMAYTRSWAVNSQVARVRLKAENDQLRQRAALLADELHTKDARMTRIPAQGRPHYLPTERMSILEMRAALGWSTQQTADAFLVTAATIASWMKRLDEQGADALVQIREPVNKFPDFIRYAVQRLKTLCPTLGKVKMAEILCRAGLHLGATTVGRILKETANPTPRKALPQCWPFCWAGSSHLRQGAFKRWCKRKAIRVRYGAVGKHGSIAVIERFIRTLKDEATRRIVVPHRQAG